MQIAPETDQGAARQHWRAALSVLGLAGLLLIAFHALPGALPWAGVGFHLALLAAGYAVTRRMLTGEGGLRTAWGDGLRWALPALAVVIAAVLAVGLFVLPPQTLAREAALVGWTLTGFSGVVLMEQGAYDPAVRDELLLHGWILGVAAQLAFAWSLAVALLRRRERSLALLALAGAAVSLALDLWLTFGGREPYAFYLAPARAWPFLLGAFLAVALGGDIDRLPAPPWLAAFGAMALPTYLWLWPLLALPRMVLARPLTTPELTAVLVAAFALGAATHRWVERPLRRGLREPRSGLPLLALVAALGLFGAWLARTEGLPGRAEPALAAEAAALAAPRPFQADCNVEDGRLPPVAPCLTPPGGEADVIVWGDSHAAHLTPAVRAWAAQRGLVVRQATHSGCPPLLRFSTGFAPRDCAGFNQAAVAEWSRSSHAKVIVMGGGWSWALASADDPARAAPVLAGDIEASVQAVRAAVGPGPRIVLLGVTPHYGFAPARCHALRSLLRLDPFRCDRAVPVNAASARDMDARLARIAESEAGVSLYRPWPVFCDGVLCRTRGGEGPWYLDRTHLTVAGGLAQTRALAGVLDNAIAPG